MKKLISIVIALSMTLSCVGIAYAAEPVTVENNYWGYRGSTIQLDEFVTNSYAMKSFYDGEIVYVITVLANGETEFVWAELGGTVRTLRLEADDVILTGGTGSEDLISNESYVEAVKNYSLSHIAESKDIYDYEEKKKILQPESIGTKGMIEADYDALMEQIEDIHGPEHVMYNWTGIASETIGELTFEYKENLSYGMTYRDTLAYAAGMTLGEVIASLLSKIPGISAPMSVIANVLGVASAVTTVIALSGKLASYNGSATYVRFVLIDGKGPYFDSHWVTSYDGWIKEGEPGSATLVETDSYYTPTQSIFENYGIQRQRAIENYS